MHAQLKRHPLFLAFALLPFAAMGMAHAEMPEPQTPAPQHQSAFGTLKHIKAACWTWPTPRSAQPMAKW